MLSMKVTLKMSKVSTLVTDFPQLFAEHLIEVYCEDGWYSPLLAMCQTIESYIKRKGDVGFKIVQIKEKFGTLRVYFDDGDDYCKGVVDMTESLCEQTCEFCGSQGELRAGRWWKTTCDQHNNSK